MVEVNAAVDVLTSEDVSINESKIEDASDEKLVILVLLPDTIRVEDVTGIGLDREELSTIVVIGEESEDLSAVCVGEMIGDSTVDSNVVVNSGTTELCTSELALAAAVVIGEVSEDISPVCNGDMLEDGIVGSKENVDVNSGNTELCTSKLVLAVVVVISEVSEDISPVCDGDMLEDGNVETVDVDSLTDGTVSEESVDASSGNSELGSSKLLLVAPVAIGVVSADVSAVCDGDTL